MEKVMEILAWLNSSQAALVFAALFAVSEALASVEKIKANSLFQLIKQGMAYLVAKYPVKK